MVWFRVDDSFYDHPKVVSIPRDIRREAIGTWTLCGVWCAKQLTDGVLSIAQVEEVGGSIEGALALVKARLWVKTKTGFRFKSWEEYQPTRAQVDAARESERTRKARQRAKPPTSDRSPAPVPVGHQQDNAGTLDGTPAGVAVGQTRVSGHPVPSRPDPTRDTHVSQSPHLPERASTTTDDDGSNQARREAYWRGWGVANPLRITSTLAAAVERHVTEDQAIAIVAGIVGKAKTRPKSVERYVLAAIGQSWAEIQQELDEAAVAA